jgi:Uncharacterized protein conserved in bacteria (DUF2188)
MAEGDVHVTWREDDAKWSVVREGASHAASLHDQKDSAERAGRQVAINEGPGYTVDETAIRHSARVEEETTDPDQAYANVDHRQPIPYREGWLPG